MGFFSDMKVLYHLAVKRVRGKNHAERMESFYGGQAGDYDGFRKKLLKGREDMLDMITPPEDAVWVDMGGGTGSNIAFLGDERIKKLKQVYVVDLASSLLEVAQKRFNEQGWSNVKAVEHDATTFTPDEGYADVVTFSYSDHDPRLVRGNGECAADLETGWNNRCGRLLRCQKISCGRIEKARLVYTIFLARLVRE